MEKYLKRLCKAILSDRFDEYKYRDGKLWNGRKIHTAPLFCSYGKIGFVVNVYDENGNHFCEIQWDSDLNELLIDEVEYKKYINTLYLENNEINDTGDGEFECYTDAGEDMFIRLEEVKKEELQSYIDNFDVNENVMLWWREGEREAHKNGVPFDNIKDHYEDYEDYLKWLQKVCDKMPY